MKTLKTAARETNAGLGVSFFFFFFWIPISRKPMLRYETYTRRHCSVR